MLPVTLERIGNDLYFVSGTNDYQQPEQIVNKWKCAGPTFRIPDEQVGKTFALRHAGGGEVMVASIPAGPFGSVDIWIESKQKADIHEIVPVPRPKVRRGVEVRYRYGIWEKYTQRDGWVSA